MKITFLVLTLAFALCLHGCSSSNGAVSVARPSNRALIGTVQSARTLRDEEQRFVNCTVVVDVEGQTMYIFASARLDNYFKREFEEKCMALVPGDVLSLVANQDGITWQGHPLSRGL